MNFKLFLESNITVSQMNDDGRMFTIVFPSGIYKFTTDYGPLITKLYRQAKYAPGKFAAKVNELVKSGLVNSEKVN